jgi:hypothetical protein
LVGQAAPPGGKKTAHRWSPLVIARKATLLANPPKLVVKKRLTESRRVWPTGYKSTRTEPLRDGKMRMDATCDLYSAPPRTIPESAIGQFRPSGRGNGMSAPPSAANISTASADTGLGFTART